MDDVVCSSFSCFTEYGAVDHVVGAGCGVVLCFYDFAEACMQVCEFAFIAFVVSIGDFDQRPRSKAAYRRVCIGEYDIRECVPVHHSTTPRAPAPASSLWVTPVWDLTFSMWVSRPFSSLVLMSALAWRRSSLWGWWA